MRTAALLLCAAALVAGCGDDDEDTTVETTTVTTTETVATTPADPVETTPVEPEPADPDAPANGHGGAEAETPVKCGRIAFNPSTDSGASGITAVGTDCDTARAVARAARNATDELTYVTADFSCSGVRSEDAGLSSIEWFCVGADREVVSFATT